VLRHHITVDGNATLNTMAYDPDGKTLDVVSFGVYYSFGLDSGKELMRCRFADVQASNQTECLAPDRSAVAIAELARTVRVFELRRPTPSWRTSTIAVKRHCAPPYSAIRRSRHHDALRHG
jgi:hypothetical protein